MLIAMMGIDGCGKTRQAELAAQFLTDQGISMFHSKAYSVAIKPIVDPWLETWDETAVNFLFQALYTQQRVEAEKALQEGKVVVADRWDEAYLAYHGLYGPLSRDRTFREAMNRYAFNERWPDLGFMFTLDPVLAKQRTMERDKAGIIDKRPTEYFAAIQDNFIALAQRRGYIVIPSDGPLEAVHAAVLSHLNRLI